MGASRNYFAVVAGFFWLFILFGLTLNDYLTRGWLGVPGPDDAYDMPPGLALAAAPFARPATRIRASIASGCGSAPKAPATIRAPG